MIINSIGVLLLAITAILNLRAIKIMQRQLQDTENNLNDMRSRLQKLMES